MKNLKQIRTDKKMSQEVLAGKVGCSRITITNIENGVHTPNWELGKAIAKALDVQMEDL